MCLQHRKFTTLLSYKIDQNGQILTEKGQKTEDMDNIYKVKLIKLYIQCTYCLI